MSSDTKKAWMYAYAIPRGTVGFPGIQADLFFSSQENFYTLWGRQLKGGEWLLEVEVPADFDNWDYVPNDY